MTILGYADLSEAQGHALWDENTLNRERLASGETFEAMVSEINAALGIVNDDFLSDPYFSGLFSVQDDPAVEAVIGSGSEPFIKKITDHSKLDPKHGNSTGWTLPMWNQGGALGWTMMGLRDRSMKSIQSDIRLAISGMKDAYQKEALGRFFKSTAEAVGGTVGASVPFCDGGTADATYIPPTYDGQPFASTHDHFLRVAALNDDNVSAAIKHLREHGHMGPYTITASLDDASTWNGLTNFYKPKWDAVDFMQNASPRAQFNANDVYVGVYESDDGIAFVKLTSRLPTNYFGVHKAFGALDSRNPLRMRINPRQGYGFGLVPGNWVGAPHLLAVVHAEFGFGVAEDRTNGVAVYVAGAGNYVDPTIS